MFENLNDLQIENAEGPSVPLDNNSVSSGCVEAVFKNLKQRLIVEINSHAAVVGCVAWLTDRQIVTALSLPATSIIVQKEDFLRPDSGGPSKSSLRSLYKRLGGLGRCDVPGALRGMSCCSDDTIDGVRCCGNHNSSRNPAHARMHNKFLVFCNQVEVPGTDPDSMGHWTLEASSVWTGSFNFTHTGGRSFENAVIIRDPAIATAYLNEWSQIAALSEPLDWDSEWCSPEWRIGT